MYLHVLKDNCKLIYIKCVQTMSLSKVRGHIGFSADSVSVGVGVPLFVPTISLEQVGEISPYLHRYIIGTSLRAY